MDLTVMGTKKDADKSKSTDNTDNKLQLALGGAPKSDVPERISVLRESQLRQRRMTNVCNMLITRYCTYHHCDFTSRIHDFTTSLFEPGDD